MSNKSPKVFLIIGKSFSGKDTLLNLILDDRRFCKKNNLEKLVKYTTRKPRPNEEDGVDYHFIDDDTYKSDYNPDFNNKFVVTSFDSEFGQLHYITDFSKLEDGKNYITTGDPESIKPYSDILGKENLCVIYLVTPNWILFKRFNKRDDNKEYSEDKWKEICRRFMDDLIKFGKSNEFMSQTNCIINVGKDLFISRMKNVMELFISGDHNSHSGVILSADNFDSYFSTFYNPAYLYSYKNIINGEIAIANGNIRIYSELEDYESKPRILCK